MWNLKRDRNEPIYETETEIDIENRCRVATGWGREGWSGSLRLAYASYYI